MGMSDYFIFDNVDTRDYEGILVYFNSVDTTPKRVGEFIEIPNRNGSFFLDGGRYEDVVHTYDIIALSKEHASDLINALASKVGYFRLQDSFNPDEYYSAVFDSKVEPNVTKERDKLTFKLTFTRKPQRWLISGESAIEVDSGDTLTNPTLFESGPLLEVTGSGAIQFNGYEIDFAGIPYGEVLLCKRKSAILDLNEILTETLNTAHLLAGDTIYPEKKELEVVGRLKKTSSGGFLNGRVTSTTNVLDTKIVFDNARQDGSNIAEFYIYPDFGAGFNYGTSKTITSTAVFGYSIGSTNYTETLTVSITYNGSNTITIGLSMSGTLPASTTTIKYICNGMTVYGFSTEPLQGISIYIDCDLGEAYYINDGEYVSLNQQIDLGSELPKLGVGENEITFDNTITELKVTPRWWKV